MATTAIQLIGRFLPGEPNIVQTDPNEPLYYDLAVGQRLVIESLSAQAFAPQGQSAFLSLLLIDLQSGRTGLIYQIPLQFQSSYNPLPVDPSEPLRDIWSMHQTVKVYVPGGVRLQLDGGRGPLSDGIGEASVIISGYTESTQFIKFPQLFSWPSKPTN